MTAKETSIIKPKVKIKVFGIGGGGNSVLMRMGQHNDLDMELVAVNTDARQLQLAGQSGIQCVQIGETLTHGRGTGGNVALGEQVAESDEKRLRAAMNGADMVFITAGMGGGTGTGAAPVVAKLARDMGVLSVGVVTVPFGFEGARKKRTAMEGVERMRSEMDALIAVENDNLQKLPENRRMSLVTAFQCADKILNQAISCVAELILTTGVINVDFADVTTIFRQSENSDALLGIGRSRRSALDAVQQAAESPLIDKGLKGARGVILNLTGDETLSLFDVDEASRYIAEHTDPEVNIILGTVISEAMDGEIQATIIATDFADCDAVRSPVGQSDGHRLADKPINLEAPSFMSGPKQPGAAGSRAFAIPAFRLTRPDGNDEK